MTPGWRKLIELAGDACEGVFVPPTTVAGAALIVAGVLLTLR